MPTLFFISALAIVLTYALIFSILTFGWFRTAKPGVLMDAMNLPKVSVIIALRNEEQNVANLINCLQNQLYPACLIQYVLVDDHSADQTMQMLKKASETLTGLQILSLPEGKDGKKQALKAAVDIAEGELLVFTDADCRMTPYWIGSMVEAYLKTNGGLLLAPVKIAPVQSPFSLFQAFEFNSLMLATSGSAYFGMPLLGNGANLAYSSKYKHLALAAMDSPTCSGDDMFVLQGFVKNKVPVFFLKEPKAMVETGAHESLWLLLQQRIRWAHKNKYFGFNASNFFGTIVYFSNATVLMGLMLALFFPAYAWFSLVLFFLKTGVDLILTGAGSGFFGLKKYLWTIPLFEIPLMAFYTVTGLAVFFPGFIWKGRAYK